MPTYKIDLKWYHNPSPMATANEFFYDLVTIYDEYANGAAAYTAAKGFGDTLYGEGEDVLITITEQT